MTSSLPKGWTDATLGEIGEWFGGGTPSKANKKLWENGTIPWVSPKDMKTRVIRESQDRITERALSSSSVKLVPADSVLIVVRSGILEHTLPTAVSAVPVTLNQDMKGIVPCPGIAVEYLALLFAALEKDLLQTCRKAGTTVASIETSVLRSVRVPIAPYSEQRRIVTMLDTHLSELNAAEVELKRARTNAFHLRDAVLERAVKDEGAKADRAFGSAFGRWSWCELGEVAEVQGGIQKQPKRTPRSNSFPFLRVANVRRGQLILDDVHKVELFGDELTRLRLQKGDLLIVEGNGSPSEIGRMAIWDGSIVDCVHQNHIIRARPGTRVTSEFLAMYWNSPTGARVVQSAASSTSGLHTLSVAKVSRIRIPVPSLEEQERIVRIASEQIALIEKAIRDLDLQLARARRVRQAILRAAIEGKLVPQDPNDEPASVLLDRIRAQSFSIARMPKRSKRNTVGRSRS